MVRNKNIEPLPDHFASFEKASDFWDTHDAGEYKEYLRPISEEITLKKEIPQAVLLEYYLTEKLKEIAKEQGISIETLVNLWLVEKVGACK